MHAKAPAVLLTNGARSILYPSSLVALSVQERFIWLVDTAMALRVMGEVIGCILVVVVGFTVDVVVGFTVVVVVGFTVVVVVVVFAVVVVFGTVVVVEVMVQETSAE
jgi:hypothetical protein